jgi:hypothetical protein
MRRFSFGDEDEEEEDEEMDIQRSFPEDFITMTQFGNPDGEIMNLAIRICEKSWLWRFRTAPSAVVVASSAAKCLLAVAWVLT